MWDELKRWSKGAMLEVLERRYLMSAVTVDASFSRRIELVPDALKLAVQADQKVLVAGTADVGSDGRSLFVERLNADGTVDTGFGVGGLFHVPVAGTWDDSWTAKVGIGVETNGNIVAGGGDAVVRLTSSGQLDNAFSGDGVVRTTAPVTDLLVQANGSIVVGDGKLVWRFETDGSVDTSFGSGGVLDASTLIGDGSYFVTDITNDSTGRLTVLGNIGDFNVDHPKGTTTAVVLRFLTDGQPDPSFGNLGIGNPGQARRFFGGRDVAKQVIVQPDGKVLVAGSTIWRLNADGTSDSGFGYPGLGNDPYGSRTPVSGAMLREPNGKIDVLRFRRTQSSNYSFARLNANGTFDSSLDHDAYVDAPDLGLGWDEATRNHALAWQNGKLIGAMFASNTNPDDHSSPFVFVTRNELGSEPADVFAHVSKSGTLVVNGSSSPDQLVCYMVNNVVEVYREAHFTQTKDILYFSASAFKRIAMDGGDGDDGLSVGLKVPCTINGGNGNDAIMVSDAPSYLLGGAGNDEISGAGGNDTIDGGEGNDDITPGGGADQIFGGKGVDLVDYWEHGTSDKTVKLFLSLDDIANDGTPKEHDNIHSDIENINGGYGDDYIVGSNQKNAIDGVDGNDTIFGGAGRDRLYGSQFGGSDGDDQLFGGKGKDTLNGGDGNDKLFGGADDDWLEGGRGKDTLSGDQGRDTLMGQDGRDVLLAADGVRDLLNGGAANDRAARDEQIDKLVSVETVG